MQEMLLLQFITRQFSLTCSAYSQWTELASRWSIDNGEMLNPERLLAEFARIPC